MEAIADWIVAVLTTTTTARAGGQRRKGAKEKDQDRGKKTNEVPNEREGERDGERERERESTVPPFITVPQIIETVSRKGERKERKNSRWMTDCL